MKATMASRRVPGVSDAGKRSSSGRQIRTSTTRPTNYYARPFGSMSGPAEQSPSTAAPGFFPALTHFTDSITALPKEVIHQKSMLKEVEAKAFGWNEVLEQTLAGIAKLPPTSAELPRGEVKSVPELLGLDIPASKVVGALVNSSYSSLTQVARDIQELVRSFPPPNEIYDTTRRVVFIALQYTLHEMCVVLDEKNAVIANANFTLQRQIARMESSYDHLDTEISEEARYGSLTHWAYADRTVKEGTRMTGHERSRRDVAATNNLAAAATAVHEGDIAAARSEARREAMAAKRARHHQIDSDFDDRPIVKKAKTGKGKAHDRDADHKAAGLGISNGQTVKKRKTEKGATSQPMERAMSSVFGSRSTHANHREGTGTETLKKRTKATAASGAAPKKRTNGLTGRSPSVTSSPINPAFANSKEAGATTNSRPGSSRNRQNSSSNLINNVNSDSVRNRPGSSTSNKAVNGSHTSGPEGGAARTAGTRSGLKDSMVQDDTPLASTAAERADLAASGNTPLSHLKREGMSPAEPVAPLMEISTSQQAFVTRSGRQSKTATPVQANFPEIPMVRSRSTRNNGQNASGANTSSSASLADQPLTQSKRSHKRGASQATNHIKPPASNASSPAPNGLTGGARMSRQSSRSGWKNEQHERAEPVLTYSSSVDDEAGPQEVEEYDGDDGDENEPRYCFCQQVSYGDMVACDNEDCPREWFHLACVGLAKPPGKNSKWYCEECKDRLGKGRTEGR